MTDDETRTAWAEFDRKYRRCDEHNRARYWCGCATLTTTPPTEETR